MDNKENEALTVVRFYHHATLNQAASKAKGRPQYDEIEVCEVRMAANKQTIAVFPALEFTQTLVKDPQTGIMEKQTYAEKYNEQYLAFKSGATQTQSGTPLTEILTPAKVLELRALHVHTVEALAALGGTAKRALGMDGDELTVKAQAYLDNSSGPAVEAIQRDKIKDLEAKVEALTKNNTVKADSPSKNASAFDSYGDDDIKNWLKEAGVEVHHLWKRKRLLDEANKKNDELAQEAKEAA